MAIFTILEPPDGNPDRVVLVRDGFDVWAFAFTALWALWRRLWVVAALLLAAYAALAIAAQWFQWHWAISAAAEGGLALIVGLEAARLQVRSWQGAGYRLAGLVQASTAEAAELSYFSERTVSRLAMPPVPYRAHRGADDTLGLFGSR